MRTLAELIDLTSPAWPLVQEWITAAKNHVEILPPNPNDVGTVLERLQVTTRSPLGAVAYQTGGLLVDHAWVRVLGSGGPRMTGSLLGWNALGSGAADAETAGALLVAHDVLGGFFALDGGLLGDGSGGAFYFAPGSLRWEDLSRGYSDLLQFFFSGDLAGFYSDYRWQGWAEDTAKLSHDDGFSLYPPPWTKEGKDPSRVSRRSVPMTELLRLELSMARQLDGAGA